VADLEAMNQAIVELINARGHLRSPAVEAAFAAVPRHLFLPGVPPEEAYRDQAIMTKRVDGMPVSSSSQPAIMAEMLEQLDVRPGHSVLEVGAGTGYNAALLRHLVGSRGSVVSVDIDPDIVAAARAHLKAAGCERVQVIHGDGGYGHPQQSPYDRIIVTVGASDVPPAWREQLKPGGRLVVPLVLVGVQASVAFVRRLDTLESVAVTCCGFMPMRGAFAVTPVELGSIEERWKETRREAPIENPPDPRGLLEGFQLWVAMRDPGYVALAPDERSYSFGVRSHDSLGLVVIGDSGNAVLRTYGPGESAGERLRRHLAGWGGAGRPGVDRLRVTSLPAPVVPRPRQGDLLLRRPCTTLVLSPLRI